MRDIAYEVPAVEYTRARMIGDNWAPRAEDSREQVAEDTEQLADIGAEDSRVWEPERARASIAVEADMKLSKDP